MIRVRLAFGLGAALAAAPGAARADTVTWAQRAPAVSPSARSGGAMAYDASRGKIVLHGGTTKAGVSRETWEWDGVTWTNVTPASAADQGPPRAFAAMAYVPGRGIVLVGEDDAAISGGTTSWVWDGVAWKGESLPGPTGRIAPSLAYLASKKALTMFGGSSVPMSDDQTWSLPDGADVWMSAPVTVRPKARYGASFAYDSKRGVVVLFGGKLPTADPKDFSDTWEWSGAAWKAFTGAAPEGRAFAATAFDQARGVVVVFGGLGASGTAPIDLGDTQEYDGQKWTSRATSVAPSPRVQAVAAYDVARSELVMFGGLSIASAGALFGETWVSRGAGTTCTSDAACVGASCVDGVCCGQKSCGVCEACDVAGSIGLCAPVKGRDDADTCQGERTCDAGGSCRRRDGVACGADADCASGHCADGVCCDTSCAERCDVCSKPAGATADGVCSPLPKGSSGTPPCAPYLCGGAAVCAVTCAIDDDCAIGSRCAEGACVPGGGAKCSGPVTIVGADGQAGTCAPYRCAAGACTMTCQTADDCAAGNTCTSAGKCVPASAPVAPPAESSCACGMVGVGGARWSGALGLAALLGLVRLASGRERDPYRRRDQRPRP
ncbi:MAG: hypothetical protein IT374_02410 [Polyangiaceae bacterium]|nr:hypothetical protein [Polyangiaceae bacterium]